MKVIYLKLVLKCDFFYVTIGIKIPFFRVLVTIKPGRSLLPYHELFDESRTFFMLLMGSGGKKPKTDKHIKR